MNVRQIALLAGLSVVIVIAVAAHPGRVATAATSGPGAPSLTTHEQEAFGFTTDNEPAPAGVSQAAAAQAASDYLGVPNSPLGVEHALANMPGETPHSAWIVYFSGGPPDPGGPIGVIVKAVPMFTGVVIDDQTGDVLRWFAEEQSAT